MNLNNPINTLGDLKQFLSLLRTTVECTWLTFGAPSHAEDFIKSHSKLYEKLMSEIDPENPRVNDISQLSLSDSYPMNEEAAATIAQMQKEIKDAGLLETETANN